MALETLPRLCRPPAAQVGGSPQRLLGPGLGPREPALEVSSSLAPSLAVAAWKVGGGGEQRVGLGLSLFSRCEGEG